MTPILPIGSTETFIRTSGIRIPDPRPDTPDRRIETNPQPLRVPLFDLTDVEPKTKKEPKKP